MGNFSLLYMLVWKKKFEMYYKFLIFLLINEVNIKLILIIMYIKMKKWKYVIIK